MPIMMTRVNDDDEKKSNLFGKHTIPGGQRGILIDARLQLERLYGFWFTFKKVLFCFIGEVIKRCLLVSKHLLKSIH